MTQVTYIISDIDKAIAFEWIVESINKDKINLSFVLINGESSYLYHYLRKTNLPVYLISCKSKKNIPAAILQCCKILLKIKPNVVHCHLFIANVVGLTSAKIMGIKSRIYTRHHSDYHHIYYPKAIKYDKIINKLSTDIISISKVVESVLIKKESVSPKKIHLIHHGFKLMEYSNPPGININRLKEKYNRVNAFPVVGVISRYTEWKGVQYIVPAFKKLLYRYPNALLVLANATGDYKTEIQKLLSEIPKKNYVEIEFEKDIFSLYKLFDVFIHVPISPESEAFGQTYIECLASGVPIVATVSGIAHEILIDKYNSLIVPYKDSNAIYDSIILIITNENLRGQIVANSFSSISEEFKLELMMHKLETLYLK